MIERRDVFLAAGVAALAAVVYLGALGVGFYSDDYEWLGRMNPTLERPSYLFTVFYRDFNPVLHASFVVDWIVGGGSAVAYHLHSLLIHSGCAAVLFLLCRRLAANSWLAAVAASTWALNVRVSEAVIWPAARGHSLATLLVLLALWLLSLEKRFSAPTAVLLFVLALFTKEMALLPLLLTPLFVARPRRRLRLWGVLAALAVAFVALNLVLKSDFHATGAGVGAMALKTPFILLRPLGLGDYYSFSYVALVAVLAAFLGLAFVLRRTLGLTGLIWVAVCTLPIIPLDKLSSRYLYMMSVGYALVLCGAAAWIGEKLRGGSTRRLAAAGGLALAALIAATNVIHIQREIRDYALLSRPYADCVARLADRLRVLAPGESLLLLDAAPRDAAAELSRTLAERGGMNKLIPLRRDAVDGLIHLRDLINVTRRTPGLLGHEVEPESIEPRHVWLYDGRSVRELAWPQPLELPAERIFAARWDTAAAFFDARARTP